METFFLDLIEKFSEINWIQVIAGSLITVLAYFARIVAKTIKDRRLKKSLIGDWYSYHYSRRNYNPIFRKEKWNIRANYFKKGITIKIEDEDDKKKELKYNGSIEFDDNYVAINLEGQGHTEIIQGRLLKPIPNDDTIMLGFHLGQDFDHEVFTTTKLVCKRKRTDEEAKKILKESLKWIEKELCLRLSKNPVPTKIESKSEIG